MNEPQSILIVDDSPFNREFFCRLVNSLGYVSRTADNGKSALAAIRSTPPDLVLLDILMPQMDGHEVLSHMRRENLLHHIPVVVVSAVDDQSSIARCIEAGADDYLIKPFNQVLLRSRITASLEKKRLRDQEEEIRGRSRPTTGNWNSRFKNKWSKSRRRNSNGPSLAGTCHPTSSMKF